MKTQKFEISSSQSVVEWLGKKVTGSHNGTIDIKHGELILSDGKLSSGHFVVDTTAIKILDITDAGTNQQFAGHLASDDFFSSQKFPEATLEISSVKENYVEGDLTIKGISHRIGFDTNVSIEGNLVKATAKIVIDRTKYDMKYRSGNFFSNLGDTLIYNDFELNVNLTGKLEMETVSIVA
jgi:polyisoprenoid-binding protein YceI